LSFLDQAVEQEFLTSLVRQIIISTATAKQLIDQLQSFIPVINPSMSRINWSTKESRKKLRLDLSLHLWNLMSFGFINSIVFCFVISYILFKCVSSLSVFVVFRWYFLYLWHWGQWEFWLGGERVIVVDKKKTNYFCF